MRDFACEEARRTAPPRSTWTAPKPITVAKLRAEPTARGLSDSGKKPDLYRRFIEALDLAITRSGSPENALGDEALALVYERFQYDDPEGLIDTVSMALKANAEPDKQTMDAGPDGISVGNTRGPVPWSGRRRGPSGASELRSPNLVTRSPNLGWTAPTSRSASPTWRSLKEANSSNEQHRERFLPGKKQGVLADMTWKDLNLISAANVKALACLKPCFTNHTKCVCVCECILWRQISVKTPCTTRSHFVVVHLVWFPNTMRITVGFPNLMHDHEV